MVHISVGSFSLLLILLDLKLLVGRVGPDERGQTAASVNLEAEKL